MKNKTLWFLLKTLIQRYYIDILGFLKTASYFKIIWTIIKYSYKAIKFLLLALGTTIFGGSFYLNDMHLMLQNIIDVKDTLLIKVINKLSPLLSNDISDKVKTLLSDKIATQNRIIHESNLNLKKINNKFIFDLDEEVASGKWLDFYENNKTTIFLTLTGFLILSFLLYFYSDEMCSLLFTTDNTPKPKPGSGGTPLANQELLAEPSTDSNPKTRFTFDKYFKNDSDQSSSKFALFNNEERERLKNTFNKGKDFEWEERSSSSSSSSSSSGNEATPKVKSITLEDSTKELATETDRLAKEWINN